MILEPSFGEYHASGVVDISLTIKRLALLTNVQNKNDKIVLEEDDRIDGVVEANNV